MTYYPQIDVFLYSHHLSGQYCIDIVRRNSVLVTHGSKRDNTSSLTLTFFKICKQDTENFA